jgi:hypothetical protein
MGYVAKKTSIPVAVYSPTGLVSVGKGLFDLKGADTLNILDNYSFEFDIDEDGYPDYWNSYMKGYDYDTTGLNAKSGKRSVHVKNDSISESRGIYTTVVLNQTQPDIVKIAGWSKCVNVSGNKDNNYSIYVDVRYQDNTPLYGQTAQFSTGTHDWEYSEKVITPTKPIKQMNLYAFLRSHTGEAWFDQLYAGKNVPTGINEKMLLPEEREWLEVYPNPFESIMMNDVLNIKLYSNYSGKADIVLVDIFGRKVIELKNLEIEEPAIQLRITNYELRAGLYFVNIRTGKSIYYSKLVIK